MLLFCGAGVRVSKVLSGVPTLYRTVLSCVVVASLCGSGVVVMVVQCCSVWCCGGILSFLAFLCTHRQSNRN